MKTLYLPGCWRRAKRKIMYAWFCTEAGEISSGPPVYSFLTFSIKLCMKSARAPAHPPLDQTTREFEASRGAKVSSLSRYSAKATCISYLINTREKKKERIDMNVT